MAGQHLLLIRHGETLGNAEKIAHGRSESPLNQRGVAQAKATARLLKRWRHAYQRVYTSPLSRARHTGEHLAEALSLPIAVHEHLIEGSLGDWEGATYQALEDFGFARRSIEDDDFDGHNGESPNQLGTRMIGAVAEVRSRHANENIIVVSHGAALAHFLALALGTRPAFGYQYLMHNSAVTEIRYPPYGETPELLTLNHYAHLPAHLRAESGRQDQHVEQDSAIR